MMTSQPLAPIIVENQVINWKVISGIAVGVHKYTKTHVSSSGGEYPTYSSIVEIIVECSIHKDDGEEVPVKLSTWEQTLRVMNGKEGFDEIRVRDGQHISVICGYIDNRSSNWLIFINHDDKKWYWLNIYANIGSFLDELGVFQSNLLKRVLWRIERYSLEDFFALGLVVSVIYYFVQIFFARWLSLSMTITVIAYLVLFGIFCYSMLSLIINNFLLFWVICIGLGLGLVSLFKIWKEQINPSRQLVKLQVAEMARSLL